MQAFKKVPPQFLRQSDRKLQLNEIYDRNDTMPQFALLASDGRQIGTWMRCKDYIQDAIWGSLKKVAYEVHGWQFDPKVDPTPSESWLILALKWPNKAPEHMNKAIENVKSTVENLETILKVPKYQRSKFSRRINDYFIVYGGLPWLRSPSTVSLFSWLLRAALTNDGRTFESLKKMKKFAVNNDGYYFRQGKYFVDFLLSNGFDAIENDWMKHESAYSVHASGFVGQSPKYARKVGTKYEDVPMDYDEEDDGF